ncbi:hypothetical protein PR048_000376 [Dryococelus australis]|uniref:Uncharacterized protein n=1 Tax=Dryococelus australis TaxID=614101 RepID=A0ABQ9IEK3_9NEOP|nr:hypothetical protein PR048_000376 [Dryococelus australis]
MASQVLEYLNIDPIDGNFVICTLYSTPISCSGKIHTTSNLIKHLLHQIPLLASTCLLVLLFRNALTVQSTFFGFIDSKWQFTPNDSQQRHYRKNSQDDLFAQQAI